MDSSVLKYTQVRLTIVLILGLYSLAAGQTSSVAPRVSQKIDDEIRVKLKGNTHPLARPEFDRGAAPDDQPMRRMLLLLKRSPEQEATLAKLLDEQQIKSAPNFHRWLTPEQFGEQFGPADSDVHAVTDWLASKGFEVSRVTAGKTVIEFSGTAGQVRQALHTEIHEFAVDEKEHWANASDPEIPAALAPVVAGIVSLNNFPRKPQVRVQEPVSRSKATSQVGPLATVKSGANTYYVVGPTDFATIYNVLPLWKASPAIDGTGVTIAIVAETNINVYDFSAFRSMWSLSPEGPYGVLQVIADGPDPGIANLVEEGEADIDTQWSGAVATGATIDLVVSETTETTAGIDLSSLYIIDNNLAPIMSLSYGACESDLGITGNAFYSSLWQQASAQGITAIVAAGDSGSDVCDYGNSPWAIHGLSVSGTAATPYNVAVGGTDFNDANSQSTYWNATNNPTTFVSAKSYIPESTWNDSCASSGLNGCPSPRNTGIDLVAGSGGPSSIYGKPAWQTGAGVPSDNARDLPDVALFAAVSSNSNSFYGLCQSDLLPGGESCSQNGFLGAGGTSVAAPAFAGIMALVVQKTGQRQGNANYVLYPLAAQSGASCTSDASAVRATGCIFYDTVTGNNSVSCQAATPNCSNQTTSGYGVLVANPSASPLVEAWTTTPGYDLATGLGSVNAANLVNNWASVSFSPTTTTLALSTTPPTTPLTVTHGQPVNVNVSVSAQSGTPTGAVSLLGGPNNGNLGIDFTTLTNGSASATTTFLPGGTYGVTAHYAGDGTFGASDSTPPVQVTVTPESSQTTARLITFVFDSHAILNPNATSIAYGTPDVLRADVTNASGNLCSPSPAALPFAYACPTGVVSLNDNGSPLDLGSYKLSSQGYTEDQLIQLSPGTHNIVASYNGDSSYGQSASGTDVISVTPAYTLVSLNAPPSVGAGDNFTITATVNTQSTGAAPSGTVQFLNGATVLATAPCTGSPYLEATGQAAYCVASATLNLASTATITGQYSGDNNYLFSNFPLQIFVTPDFSLVANPTSLAIAGPGQSATTTITLAPADGFTGKVNLGCTLPFGMTGAACSFNPAAPAISGTGNVTSTLTITTLAPSSALPKIGPPTGSGRYLISLVLSMILLLLMLSARRRSPRFALSLLALVAACALYVSCGGGGGGGVGGGGNSGTPAGTYTVGVSAGSGTLLHSMNVTVVVQ